MPIRTIADLETADKTEVEEILRRIDVRGLVYRQMKADGRQKGMTRHEYIAKLKEQGPVTCKHCEGEGVIVPRMRTVGTIHSSSAHKCRTRLYYDVTGELAPEDEISPELQFIFDIGHALHARVQRALSKALGEHFEAEVPVNIIEALIADGSADGVLDMGDHRVVLEIKTINASEFADLNKPKPDHVLQASLYATGLDIPFICFLYIGKENLMMKQFPIVYDRAVYTEWWYRNIPQIEDALESGKPPVANAKKYECKQCPYTNGCPQSVGRTSR